MVQRRERKKGRQHFCSSSVGIGGCAAGSGDDSGAVIVVMTVRVWWIK